MKPPAIPLPLNAHTPIPFKEHDVVNLTLTGTIISIYKIPKTGEQVATVEVNHETETFIFDLPTSALSLTPPPTE